MVVGEVKDFVATRAIEDIPLRPKESCHTSKTVRSDTKGSAWPHKHDSAFRNDDTVAPKWMVLSEMHWSAHVHGSAHGKSHVQTHVKKALRYIKR